MSLPAAERLKLLVKSFNEERKEKLNKEQEELDESRRALKEDIELFSSSLVWKQVGAVLEEQRKRQLEMNAANRRKARQHYGPGTGGVSPQQCWAPLRPEPEEQLPSDTEDASIPFWPATTGHRPPRMCWAPARRRRVLSAAK